jgi:ferrous iron transport protein A
MSQLLQDIEPGTECTIVSIDGDAGAALRARELGLLPGTRIRVVRKAPFRGPIEIATPVARLGIRPTDGLVIRVAA